MRPTKCRSQPEVKVDWKNHYFYIPEVTITKISRVDNIAVCDPVTVSPCPFSSSTCTNRPDDHGVSCDGFCVDDETETCNTCLDPLPYLTLDHEALSLYLPSDIRGALKSKGAAHNDVVTLSATYHDAHVTSRTSLCLDNCFANCLTKHAVSDA